ncbi:MAG: hypothetical protein DHS20C21_19020 [Gemmatimonadota bacterium]|nr:MAG: hypothetical protein DHS20C21_19020 [Gemmatimonadota bacterium]
MGPTVSFAPPRLEVELVARPDSIPVVSSLVQTFLTECVGLGPNDVAVSHVRIAVVEAVTNVVRHAYPGEPGPIALALEFRNDTIAACIRDAGEEFDPTNAADLPDPTELAEGGYGLGIMQSVMEELEHEYRAGFGNEFTMKKRISR